MSYTPGHWYACNSGLVDVVYCGDPNDPAAPRIAEMLGPKDETADNARLMAAAPALFKAVHALVDNINATRERMLEQGVWDSEDEHCTKEALTQANIAIRRASPFPASTTQKESQMSKTDKLLVSDNEALVTAAEILKLLQDNRKALTPILEKLDLSDDAFRAVVVKLDLMPLRKTPPALELPSWEIQQYELCACRYKVKATDAAAAVAAFFAGDVELEAGVVNDVVDIVTHYGMAVSQDFAEKLKARGVDVQHRVDHARGEHWVPSLRSVEPWSDNNEDEEDEDEEWDD
jgi:hypothetical protein